MSKYNRSYHFDFSLGATNDDRICRDISKLQTLPTVTTEKLDGSNTGITKGGVYGRSHAEYTQNPWDKNMGEIWRRVGQYIDTDMFIFGENMYALHSIEYLNLNEYFYVFGIRVGNEWLSWDDVEENAYLLDLPVVPVLYKGILPNIQTSIEELVQGESKLGCVDLITRVPQMEGCVTRLQQSFNDSDFSTSLCKYVRANHVTSNEHWQHDWRRGMGKIAKLINGNINGYIY